MKRGRVTSEMFDKYEIRKKFTNERNQTSTVDEEVADRKKERRTDEPQTFRFGSI